MDNYITTKIVNSRGGVCGFITDQFFTIYVKSPLLLKKVHSLDLEMDFIEKLINEDVEVIMIVDIPNGQIYKSTLIDFRKKGIQYLHPEYGLQLCLPFSFWMVLSVEIQGE